MSKSAEGESDCLLPPSLWGVSELAKAWQSPRCTGRYESQGLGGGGGRGRVMRNGGKSRARTLLYRSSRTPVTHTATLLPPAGHVTLRQAGAELAGASERACVRAHPLTCRRHDDARAGLQRFTSG